MSWIQRLYETYERCAVAPQFADAPPLPIGHTTQQAHVEIVLDEQGGFRRATVVSKEDHTTLVPCTEESGGRAGVKPANHPLCDKLQYVGGDFVGRGGNVTSGFAKDPNQPHRDYVRDLSAWARSPQGHSKLNAVLAYVQEDRLIGDLIAAGVLPVDERGRLLKQWQGDRKGAPSIFGVVENPEDSFVRWRVEQPGDLASGTWQDRALVQSWIAFYASRQTKRGLCMVTGEQTTLAEQHPAKLRNAADKAKLISSNDLNGFTFRGRFIDADEACGVGFAVTQKAHSVLRWLISRQGYRNGDQVIVSWAVAGQPIPDPFNDSRSLFLNAGDLQEISASDWDEHAPVGDVGQSFAVRLRKAIAGYRTNLEATDDVVVMAVDSATPGRMAITFYRELKGSEFIERVLEWHESCAWYQDFGWDTRNKQAMRFIGAPSPSDIAEAAFGPRADAKLRKATVERLLPCIVDGRSVPRDLVSSTVQRTSNRCGLDRWQWEKSLGIACALYRGSMREKEYSMTLEADRTSRDYLFGRLLALAEHIEARALYVAGEKRDTTAARLMHRFADRPATTWPSIERALGPYKTRLRSKRPGFLHQMELLLDDVVSSFSAADFLDDHKLTGEYLLGYHCQRHALSPSKSDETDTDQEPTDI